MEDVKDFFKESDAAFTIYVVEQKFVVGRGAEYFRGFKGTNKFIDTDKKLEDHIGGILKWINKRIPNLAGVVKNCFTFQGRLSLIDIVTELSKLFSVETHQAAGPEVLDPLIIQEGALLAKHLSQLISLHKESILRPAIIILLKDNDFDRAKKLLSGCPHGINIKMIRNSGKTEIYKVINSGVDNPEAFINAFAQQCFNTCSHTKRDVLLNEEWMGDSFIRQFAPSLMKIRASLLCDEKNAVRKELSDVLSEMELVSPEENVDFRILEAFICMARLSRVYCNDSGGEDIAQALKLAKDLENQVLLAQVYRYSFFMSGPTFQEKLDLLVQAKDIFEKNGMADHAIYCENNRLVRKFDTDTIDVREFLSLREEAVYNVPGLVGMSHIFNNTGVAHLMTGNPEDALQAFDAGLDYVRLPERSVQRLAILCNQIIAKTYNLQTVSPDEIRRTLNLILDNMGQEKLPFLSARYVMNLIAVAFHCSSALGRELLQEYPVAQMVQKAFQSNQLGAGQLALQMDYLTQHYSAFQVSVQVPYPLPRVTGKRRDFILRYGYNPILFSTWL